YNRISDELLHRPTEALEPLSKLRVIWSEHGAQVLGVSLLRASDEVDKIGEQDAHDLALLARARIGCGNPGLHAPLSIRPYHGLCVERIRLCDRSSTSAPAAEARRQACHTTTAGGRRPDASAGARRRLSAESAAEGATLRLAPP